MIRSIIIFVVLFVISVSCTQPKARRPKLHSTNNFYKEIIASNKKLNALETKRIHNYIQQDTLRKYYKSSTGYWYSYDYKSNDTIASKPQTGNLVTIEYDITTLKGNIIYPKKKIYYKVDKQDLIPALQDGIKLMKPNETITFVIPSFRAFGIAGDGKKIGINTTIKSKLTLIKIN